MLCCNQDPFLVLPENTLLERKQELEAVCFGDNDEYHKPKVMVKSFHSKENLQIIAQYQQHPTFYTATKSEFILSLS